MNLTLGWGSNIVHHCEGPHISRTPAKEASSDVKIPSKAEKADLSYPGWRATCPLLILTWRTLTTQQFRDMYFNELKGNPSTLIFLKKEHCRVSLYHWLGKWYVIFPFCSPIIFNIELPASLRMAFHLSFFRSIIVFLEKTGLSYGLIWFHFVIWMNLLVYQWELLNDLVSSIFLL